MKEIYIKEIYTKLKKLIRKTCNLMSTTYPPKRLHIKPWKLKLTKQVKAY